MSAPLCVVVGAGRLGCGYLAPVLADAGWRVVLVGRSLQVVGALRAGSGLLLCVAGPAGSRRWIGGLDARTTDDDALPDLIASADLVTTSVGPGALTDAGRWLGPLLRARLDARSAGLNVITFENHRRAPELLAAGLLAAEPSLAPHLGRRLGISGAAAWEVVSRTEVGPDGLCAQTEGVAEAYLDRAALRPGLAPLDGSLPAWVPVEPFDDWMIEKLWVFNGGHAAPAYLGWGAGAATMDAALARPDLHEQVEQVVRESQFASTGAARDRPQRTVASILSRYANPALADPVSRVAREPRRKLAAGDRLLGPAVACLGAGRRPVALARVIAAALAYRGPGDREAATLAHELDLLGPAEVLASVCGLAPGDELSRLICAGYKDLTAERVSS